ncbi:MAG: pentapeptide repeat-containing protein [Acaryochloridaceae cyanobacterium SU_2_1]|nr:pentapeptide repeat-containing protein [Acaryochloridaceae cyanobacterium SU_2_1]
MSRAKLGGVDLRHADINSTNLSATDLINADLSESQLIGVNLSEAQLSGANCHKTRFIQANLNKANLSETNLTAADLRRADLRKADLSGSQLQAANLSTTNLTAACFEDTHLNRSTKFDQTICEHIYLKKHEQDRQPSHGKFLAGEMAQLLWTSSETINLNFHNGVNWTAFANALKRVQQLYPQAQLGVQCIEHKGNGMLLVKVHAAPEVDRNKVHKDLMLTYVNTRRQLNQQQDSTYGQLPTQESVQLQNPQDIINHLFDLLNPSLSSQP